MTEEKNWYASRTVWGGLIALLAALAKVAGVDLSLEDQTGILDGVTALTGGIGGLLAIYGRLRARHRLV
ncbi:hypothetical protein BJF93_19445 [Xaviernesmea oryzae]|uniref:Holin n=1 Tax=Xaviernesmea oryzae TaxID=464029 RepID=A0A1Q9B1H2_9HYPH|nr:hypothetical protein [Xaviernesmea oryzae]OLP61861.1 hypothetical protein BJF93_19445 [Xaviernesmea oryzae]SEL75153.1 hypothetical protein SAMN04487976_11251 [Xaviernesmea oryzae]